MTVETGLRFHLLDEATIAGLVGARIYPLRLPQKATFPAIVLQRISSMRWKHLRGADALARPRYQVDCWAQTHDAATSLGNLVRQRLNGFAGTWTSDESPEVIIRVQGLFIENEQDLFEEEILGGLCRHSADYFLYHSTAEGSL